MTKARMRKSQLRQLRSVLQYARQQAVCTCTVCNTLQSQVYRRPWYTLLPLCALRTSSSLNQWMFQPMDAAVRC